jgi:murein DD-endopeptidase MepM/ murein hydrolase activator NlpD
MITLKMKLDRLSSVLLAGTLVLAACGGGEPSATSQSPEPAPLLNIPAPVAVASAFSAKSGDGRQRSQAATTLDSRSVLGSEHDASWAYFMDPTQSRWYIAQATSSKQDIFSLGPIESGRESWWRAGSAVTSVNNWTRRVQTDPGLQTAFSTSAFWYLSGGSSYLKYDNAIVRDRELIQGSTVPVLWYFFRAPNFSWYIANTEDWGARTTPTVYKFAASSDGASYDWQKVDIGGAEIQVTPQASSARVKFKDRFIFPIALPANTTITSPDSALFNTSGFSYLQDAGTTYSVCANTGVRVTRHPGVDINVLNTTGNADDGTPILAIYDGVVTGRLDTQGAVAIRHTLVDGSQVWSSYRHMRNISVNTGDVVRRGATIGLMSGVGGNFLSHLHFEIRSANHPDPGNENYWCGYSNQTLETLRSWLPDPIAYIRGKQ